MLRFRAQSSPFCNSAPDYDSGGHGFESCPVRHFRTKERTSGASSLTVAVTHRARMDFEPVILISCLETATSDSSSRVGLPQFARPLYSLSRRRVPRAAIFSAVMTGSPSVARFCSSDSSLPVRPAAGAGPRIAPGSSSLQHPSAPSPRAPEASPRPLRPPCADGEA